MTFTESELLLRYPYRSKEPVLVDVGGHQGSFSRQFARKGWRVIAFEPEPYNRSIFEQKLAAFDKVTCLPNAVSDKTGDIIPFYVSENHSGIHSIKPFHKTHRATFDIETIRLSDALEALDPPQVTLLKVDIEGADFLALRGFSFDRFHPELIMTEFMNERSVTNFGYTHHDVATYMRGFGYVTFVSEWAPIQEYARDGQPVSHHWIQCLPYPLSHEPAWGNLIFIPIGEEIKFVSTLERYILQLKRWQNFASLRNQIKRIPGAHKLYQLIKG